MSTFSLLSQEKRDEIVSMLPEVDQTSPYPLANTSLSHDTHFDYYNNHHSQNNSTTTTPIATTTLNQNFFTKSENPIFWNTVSDWQSMLSQGEFILHQQIEQQLDSSSSPPLLPSSSPSPPITTNNSSTSNKSTTSNSSSSHHNRVKSTNATKSDSSSSNKKDKFKDEAFESYWGELIDKERAHNVAG